jgi:hypothetical protein
MLIQGLESLYLFLQLLDFCVFIGAIGTPSIFGTISLQLLVLFHKLIYFLALKLVVHF